MILVFDKTGQVATELQRLGNVVALGRDQADLSDPEACIDVIRAQASCRLTPRSEAGPGDGRC